MKNETIEDIVREMRKRFKPYAKSDSNDARYVAYLGYAEFADRIEAAIQFRDLTKKEEVGVSKTETTTPTCKESLQVGNASKMRVALHLIHDQLKSYLERTISIESMILRIKNEINAALSAPARNCDLYLTPKDAMLAHLEEVYEGEKVEFGDYEWCEFFKWLFAEAKEFTNK